MGSRQQTSAAPQGSDAGTAGEIRRVTLAGMLLNILLSAAKISAGWLGHSHAVLADGFHSLSDCVTDVAILVGVRYWDAPPDEDHPHGHRRIETVVTIMIGLVLAAVAVGIGYRSIVGMSMPHLQSPGLVAAVAAAISIVAKEWLFRWTLNVGTSLKSPAVIANAWHHRSDAYSSIPALLAVSAAVISPQLRFLDHLGGVVVSLFILHTAIQIAKPALAELVDAGASQATRKEIERLVEKIAGVLDVHNLRTRYMGSGLHVDLHVMVDPQISVHAGHDIAHEVEEVLLQHGPHVIDVLVHIEPYSRHHED